MKKTYRILTTFRKSLMLTVILITGVVTSFADKWDGETPATLSDAGITGTGTSSDPYIIETPKAFAYFGSVMEGNSSHWKMTEGLDIDLDGKTWTYGVKQYQANFAGTFDGNGGTVRNFKLEYDNNCYGGLFCGITGKVQRLTVSNVTATDGHKWNTCCYGILAAIVEGEVATCKVESSSMSFTSEMKQWGSYISIGGMVGRVANGGVISDSKTVGVSISTAALDAGATIVSIGGVAGLVGSASSMKKCGASGANLNILLTRGTGYGYNQGSINVGGVVGNVVKPCDAMPEGLCAYNCKINAPFGAVGPVCGMFQGSSISSNNVVSDDYSAEGDNISTAQREKTNEWMYNGYQLGLSAAVQNCSLYKNYSAALTDGYLDVGDATVTLPRQNSVSGTARNSHTVIWYTQNNGSNATSTNAQGIYPSYSSSVFGTSTPAYYCYFMQGYNVGTYVSAEQASSYINSLAYIATLAKVALVDENLGQRGTMSHTINMTYTAGDIKSPTWKWYVNGKETGSANSATVEVAPNYSGTTTVMVSFSDGAVASLTLPRAYLPTMNSPKDNQDGSVTVTYKGNTYMSQIGTIADDNKTRGSKENPYMISTAEELRYWSELSRMSGTIDNGPILAADGSQIGTYEDNANHFNTAYFVLGRNIDLDPDELSTNVTELQKLSDDVTYYNDKGVESNSTYSGAGYSARHKFNPAYNFDPICGFTSEDIYDSEHTFRGSFDGDGKIIKNLRQIWRGGSLAITYDEHATECYGLFGCVGGGATVKVGDEARTDAVVKNVIIENAIFEHDVYNGTFAYAMSRFHKNRDFNDSRGTNVAVGALAGMVTRNADIYNIDVRKSCIVAAAVDNTCARTDYSCFDIHNGKYQFHLWVGGIVGRVQAAYDQMRGDVAGSVKLHYLSTDIDIDIPMVSCNAGNISTGSPEGYSGSAKRFYFNAGGIVGSMYTTAGYTSLPWPEHVFFTGQMRGMCMMGGPIFGYVNYGAMNENITTSQQIHEHWIGYPDIIKTGYYNNYWLRLAKGDEQYDGSKYTNPNANGTYLTGRGDWRNHASAGLIWAKNQSNSQNAAHNNTINGGLYGSGGKLMYFGPITDSTPADPLRVCTLSGFEGARSILSHGNGNEKSIDGNQDVNGYYIGVNQGIWKDWNNNSTLQNEVKKEFSENGEKAWAWEDETAVGDSRGAHWSGRPVLTSQSVEHLEAALDSTKVVATLHGVETGLDDFSYEWYDICNNKVQAAAKDGRTYTYTSSVHDQFFYAMATNGNKTFKSDTVRVPGTVQASEFSVRIDTTVVYNPQKTYGSYADYMKSDSADVRISQAEFYNWDASKKTKSVENYYPCGDVGDCINKWLYDYDHARTYFDWVITGDSAYLKEEKVAWTIGAYIPEPKYYENGDSIVFSLKGGKVKKTNVKNWAEIWYAYQKLFKLSDMTMTIETNTNNGVTINDTIYTPASGVASDGIGWLEENLQDNATAREILLRTPAVLYSYKEFLAADQRTGEYTEGALDLGFTYTFAGTGNDTNTLDSSSYAGTSWLNKDKTKEQYDDLNHQIPATIKTTMTAKISPEDAKWLAENKYVVSYLWTRKGDGIIVGNESYLEVTLDANSNRGEYECLVTIRDTSLACYNFEFYRNTVGCSWGKDYIYINPNSVIMEYTEKTGTDTGSQKTTGVGDDINDGKTPQTPVKTWPRAYQLLTEGATWDQNYIILIGNSSAAQTREGFGLGTQNYNGNSTTGTYAVWYNRGAEQFMNRNATITTLRDDGVNFQGKLQMANSSGNGTQFALFGDTRLEHLTLTHESPDNGYGIIMCQYHSLELGEGIVMENFPSASSASAEVGPLPGTRIADLQIFGGCNNDDRFLRVPGSVSNYELDEYLPHPEGFTITVRSGFCSNVCASGRQSCDNLQNGIVGTPNRPIKGTIIIDIDRKTNTGDNVQYGNSTDKVASYDIGAVMAGNHEGAQYGDMDIIIRSGIIGRVTSGSLGNKRKSNSFGTSGGFYAIKDYYGSAADVYMPFDTYFGRCNILVDPASSRYTDENDIDKRVVVSEIYGGALGRHMGNSSNTGVCMSTFYGKSNITINGGTFDLNCWESDDLVNNSMNDKHTEPGLYGLKAYQNKTAGTKPGTYDQNGKKYYYMAQPGIYGGGAGGFNGIGTDSLHTNDLRLPYLANVTTQSSYTSTEIEKFGNKVVLYGDYEEYKKHTGADKVYFTCIDSIVGTKKYTTKIDPAETSSTITINGGVFFPRELPQGAGIYGAGNGYVNNQLINFPSQAPNPLGGSVLGAEGKTAVEININGGTFNCDVYGGGRGNDIYYYRQLGYNGDWSWVGREAQGKYDIDDPTDFDYLSFGTTQDSYSRNAQITGNVVMNINGGTFKGNIYGSGAGTGTLKDNSNLIAPYGKAGNPQGEGCLNMARIWGNTTVNINSDSSTVHVYGNVYGGGDNARVKYNTEVNINKGVVYGSVFGGGNKATVGIFAPQDVYAADSYWRVQDDVNYAVKSALGTDSLAAYVEELERLGMITNGGAQKHLGELKEGATSIGTKIVGTGHTTVYTMTDEAYVYGDIYGGGNAADVNGDTYVGMSAGHVGGAIYGGGNGVYDSTTPANNKLASVHGFTDVFLNGYTVMWDKMFDVNAFLENSYNDRVTMNDIDAFENIYIKTWAKDKSRFVETTQTTGSDGKTKNVSIWLDPRGGRNAHNIYGGGNAYCAVDSTARVTVTRGMTPKALLETEEWEQSYYDNDNPHFYVFGGGYGEQTTVGNTIVNVGMEDILTEDATTTDVLAKGSTMFLDEDGNPVSNDKANAAGDPEHSIGIYSNGYGIAGYTVLGVLGGGMEGKVLEDTKVTIGGNTYIHRVYGGGYGKRDRADYTVQTDLGHVGGHTRVTANGGLVYGDIFGGGARGDVDSTTYVEVLRDCEVYGSVYGGGDVAWVGDANHTKSTKNDTVSTVVAAGGTIFHNVFAGGSRGPVYGSTFFNSVDSTMNGKPISPYIYGDIYGGGEMADVEGNTHLLIEGGQLARDIYGGGLGVLDANGGITGTGAVSANIGGNTNITVNGGSMLWSQQCDDYTHGQVYYFDNTNVIETSRYGKGLLTADDISGTEGFFDWSTMHVKVNHNVYGGGNVFCTVTGNSNVTMNHGLVTEGLQYYDEATLTPFAMMWYELIKNKSYPQFSVLGGGYGKYTTIGGDTHVSMNVSNYIEPELPENATADQTAAYEAEKKAYDEYKKYKSYEDDYVNFRLFEEEMKSRWNSLSQEQRKLLYGSSFDNNQYRRFRVSRYAWSGGVHGHVMANVYGGSWAGKVGGNTTVTMDGTSGCRNVFGGGVGMATATANADKLGEVVGTSTVIVNGSIISGSVYGGGAGVESAKDESGNPTLDYDDVARVVKSSEVNVYGKVVGDEDGKIYSGDNGLPIDATIVYGTIAGGGDVASVGAYQNNYDNIQVAAENAEPVTAVSIHGGHIMSDVYAGGCGRPDSLCVDYTRLGAVYGNTKLVVDDSNIESQQGYVFGNVFGGGMCGTVFGHTDVDIQGSNFGNNIFAGGYGIVDTVYTANGAADTIRTDAAVKGNTRLNISGGDWLLSSVWLITDEEGKDIRAWKPANTYGNQTYGSQYDPYNRKFVINHNAYGGGYNCSTIDGDAYVTMTNGMLDKTAVIGREDAVGDLFQEREWLESYNKIGSAHFSVFGAGYGKETLVKGDTHVDISIEGECLPSDTMETKNIPYNKRFVTKQSLLDVIGGGYNGKVNGETNVHIGGNTFMRRVFTGGYYAPVKETNLLVTSGDIDEVFGGGLIGDVYENTNIQIGWREEVTFDGNKYSVNDNSKLFINKNVYGGNDVSGTVGYKNEQHQAGQGTYLKMYGGNLYGDVYGGGNGDYLYALGVNGETEVTPNEHYLKTAVFEGYDLVYTVPMRDGMISSNYASDAQKIVNISTFRPSTIESNIELYGLSESDRLNIRGNVFGGGNCATVDGLVTNTGVNSAKVTFNIKDNINVGGVFLGSDGDALFVDSEKNSFLSNFQTINNLNLEDTVKWETDPANRGIKKKYLPVDIEDRPIVYPHLLDLYFLPVEMSIQPTVLWNGSATGNVSNATIGIFCCGGNRGNMNVYPAETGANKGNVVDIKFPTGLEITKHIIGGCNNANYEWHNSATGNVTKHTGGYLLGERKSEKPMIRLLVENVFKPDTVHVTVDGEEHVEYTGGNVYGGCYKSGTINGDVTVDLRSNMLKGLRKDYFDVISDIGASSCNVYGAGYGTNSYVYGDTKVIVGKNTNCKTATTTVNDGNGAKGVFGDASGSANATYEVFNDDGTSASYIFGGGLQGNVVGNATVEYLNGHTLHSVTGGSYAGYLWGSTQVLVGYPDYYVVKDKKQAVYAVDRKDKRADNLAVKTQDLKGNVEKAIKQEVKLMAGDIIAPTLYESIVKADASKADNFEYVEATAPSVGWDNVAITIDEAIYGGGYSLASGSSVMANNTIVLKYDDEYNTDDKYTTLTSVGYGGNTTMVVWDKMEYNGTGDTKTTKTPGNDAVDHISISQQRMTPVDLPTGTDLFGYYYEDKNGHYHYIYEENKYFQGLQYPKPPGYTGTFVSAYDFDAEGGMYGDGHLSFSEGFRTGEIKGYGFNGGRSIEGARLMNSFQRMDILRVEDCNVIMLGARDYATNVTNTTPYSLSRIGELQLVSHIDDSGELKKVSIVNTDSIIEGDKGARNFLGLSNNILYVGCVYTNTDFSHVMHEYDNTKNANDSTYQQKKQYCIDEFYPYKDKKDIFQLRNDATAKNMIGISSGYAMKIQNVSTSVVGKTIEDGSETNVLNDSVFYGPIVGVAEVNLMSSRLDEGGGYIYADNVHDRPTVNGTDKVDFLVTTGNFVFPHTDGGRYILDDCYVKSYDETLGVNGEAEEAHYWYIEGYNYYYNIHITGYTSDSRNTPMEFDSDNTDLLTILKGAKKGQKVTVHSIRWRSEHIGKDDTSYDECDIDGNYKANGTYPASMTTGNAAPADAVKYGSATPTWVLNDTTKQIGQRWTDDYYKLRFSAHDDTTLVYKETADTLIGDKHVKSVYGDLQRAVNTTSQQVLDGVLLTDEPVIAMQLVDAVDNTTEAYYKRHLSETCKATVVLTVPALDENGTQIQGYTTVSAFYTDSISQGLDSKVPKENTLDLSGQTKYYFFNDNTHEYNTVDLSMLRYHSGSGLSEADYKVITGIRTNEDGLFIVTYKDGDDEVISNAVTNVFLYGPRNYTYTLYLTIDYVQGPEVRGHINIENCALPGEMVKLTTKNVKIAADESMAPIGYYWRVGMRKYDEKLERWVFADETKWSPATVEKTKPAGYDSYRVNGSTYNGVFKGVIYDEDDNYLLLPVYYFMNGYGVQYGIEFNGLEGQIFPVSMAESDTLLIHNYHRMSTHATNSTLHLHFDEAAARAKAYEEYVADKTAWDNKKTADGYADKSEDDKETWNQDNPEPTYVAPLRRPRVYLQDEEDMVAFYNCIDSIGRYNEGTHLTEAQIGTKKYTVPTGGNYMYFVMQDSISFNKLYYHAPTQDFEGDLDGRGHTVDLTNTNRITDQNVPALLRNVKGNVMNLGVLGKSIATSVEEDDTAHIFNSFVYGMKNKKAVTIVNNAATAGNNALDNCYDLSVANDYDFNYGRVAYNLNKYYLNERYRRNKGIATAYNDRIEQYFGSEDFQYEWRNDSQTGKVTGVQYLRTGATDMPAYASSDTRHDKHHYIDKARATVTYLTQAEADTLNAKFYDEYEYEINSATTGSPIHIDKDPYSTKTVKSVTYRPLFNEPYADEAVGKMEKDTLRNDYLLFGQNLGEKLQLLPKNIASSMNADATNRVWRASGFYGSKKDEGFYYNAMTNMATMVNDPRLTAIDFTCQRDGDITNAESWQNDEISTLTSIGGAADDLQSVYFAPTKDTPVDELNSTSYWKFGIAAPKSDGTHVTQNLLVYTAPNSNSGTKVKEGIEYTAQTSTEDILGHRVVVGTPNHTAALLHLVDKEDFNAPIAFVASRAWYDRDPSMETGYVDEAGQGWESITLPFSVAKTELSEPIERFYDYPGEVADAEHKRNTKKEDQSLITFFYGEGDTTEDNPNVIDHEYWLRSMTGVERQTATGKLTATFKRPLNSQEDGGFAAYTPFVVSFPGSKFYEFDMTGRSITFSNSDALVDITDDAVKETKKSGTSGTHTYTHYAAFMNEEGAANTYAIALRTSADDTDIKGDKFTASVPVYPFRTKIVSEATSGAKAASYADYQAEEPEYIYISSLGVSLEDKGVSEPETEDVIESEGLRIYPSGKRIVVESTYATTIKVYGAGGQLVRVLDVRPGTSIYSGFASGVYVVEQKKMLLK